MKTIKLIEDDEYKVDLSKVEETSNPGEIKEDKKDSDDKQEESKKSNGGA